MATTKPKISIYLSSEEQKQALESWAKEEKRTISNLISFLLDKALEERQKKNSSGNKEDK
jgi:hypothetical protein